MAERRRYTKRERVTAVVAADMTSPDAAAAATGIPVRNIYRWRDDPEMAGYVTKTRDALADDILVVAALAWDRLLGRIKDGDIDTRDLIVAAGVAVDKSQLLSGMATSRTESRDLSGISDADVIGTLRAADAIIAASTGRAAPPLAGPPEGEGV